MEPSKNRSGESQNKSFKQSPDLVGEAKGLAGKVADQAKEVVSDKAQDQQQRSAGNIGKVAKALHRTSEDLADTMAAPYVEKAAAALDRMSGSVREANLRDIVEATERFARKDPVLFVGGAFAIGLIAARFLKSSARATSERPQRILEPVTDPEVGESVGIRGQDEPR